MEPQRGHGDGTGVVPTDGTYVPSDLYYANLYHHTGTYPALMNTAYDNWDANGNGRYNEGTWLAPNPLTTTNPDNVDGYPDICVARVTAHTTDDVTAYAQKVIAYETASSRAVSLIFVADQQYGGSVGLTNDIVTNSKVMDKVSAAQIRVMFRPVAAIRHAVPVRPSPGCGFRTERSAEARKEMAAR